MNSFEFANTVKFMSASILCPYIIIYIDLHRIYMCVVRVCMFKLDLAVAAFVLLLLNFSYHLF